jgi:hypothetical protein
LKSVTLRLLGIPVFCLKSEEIHDSGAIFWVVGWKK